MAIKLVLERRISLEAQAVMDSEGGNSALSLSENNVCIGPEKFPKAKLHIIDSPKDSNGNTLILGNTNSSNLRLGYHKDYSWIQSHGLRPLYINDLGNDTIINGTGGNVGVGIKSPICKLDVGGVIKAKSLILDGLTIPPKGTQTFKIVVDSEGNVYSDPSLDSLIMEKLEKLEEKMSLLQQENDLLKSQINHNL